MKANLIRTKTVNQKRTQKWYWAVASFLSAFAVVLSALFGDTNPPSFAESNTPQSIPKRLDGTTPIQVEPDNTALPNPIPSNFRFVAVNGSDENNGSSAAPFATLRHAVANTPEGGTIVMRAGTYREGGDPAGATAADKPIQITKKLIVRSAPNAQVWIKGSDTVPNTGWTVDATSVAGRTLYRRAWTREMSRARQKSNCNAVFPNNHEKPELRGVPRCLKSQDDSADRLDMFFINGARQAQVKRKEDVVADTFAIDYANNVLYFGTDPRQTSKTIEATLYEQGLEVRRVQNSPNINASETEIRGIGFAHYADRAIEFEHSNDIKFIKNTVVWNANIGAAFQAAQRPTVEDNAFLYNGHQGVAGNGANEMLLKGNNISYNNLEDFNPAWSAAGIKVILSRDMVWRDNTVIGHKGNAMWLDVWCENTTVVNNDVRDNWIGIFSEISGSTVANNGTVPRPSVVASNLVVNNGTGISSNGTNNIEIWNNTLAGNNVSIAVIDDKRALYYDPEGFMDNAWVCRLLRRGITGEGRETTVKNNIMSKGKSGNGAFLEVRHDNCTGNTTVCPRESGSGTEVIAACNNTSPLINPGDLDYNSYYRADLAVPANIISWKLLPSSTVVRYQRLNGTNGFKEQTGNYENNAVEYTGAINPFFATNNPTAKSDFRLKSSAAELYNGTPLPVAIAERICEGLAANETCSVTAGDSRRGALTLNAAPPPPNQEPTVTLTAPAAGTTVVSGTSVTLSATASDVDGTITSVEFLQGATVIAVGTRVGTSNNYTATWTPTAVGAYSISAQATDNRGATQETSDVTITVQAPAPPPPTLAIASFRLVNADTNQPISAFNPIANNATVDLSNLPTRNVNICANVASGTAGSVVLSTTGGAHNYNRVENGAPYCLGTNGDGNVGALNPRLAPGTYTLRATPYSGSGGTGTAGTTKTLTFRVVN